MSSASGAVCLGTPGDERQRKEKTLAGLLRRLWDSIICEIVRNLGHVPKNSRIWWCPSGPFTSLPIHAAYPYRKGKRGLSDIYVPSYTPTFSALIQSRMKRGVPQGTPRLIAIRQPNSATLFDRQELDLIRQFLPGPVQFTGLTDEAATRDAALTALGTHPYVHVTCHWQHVPERPFDSHFAMHDGRLTLLDIIRSRADHTTEFAFLSACNTAARDVGRTR